MAKFYLYTAPPFRGKLRSSNLPANDNYRLRIIDANGRVTGITATVSGTNTTLASSGAYLPFGPLASLTYGNAKVLSAGFDTDYNPTSRAVAGIYSNAYTTDKNGNVTGVGAVTYGYDALDRVNAENTGGATSYTYDLTDNRLTKVAGSTTTYYVYGPGPDGPNGLLYGEYGSTGGLVREYIYMDASPLAQVTAGSPETVAWLHVDHLDTPRYATNAAGAQVWSWTPDAFGTSAPTGTLTLNLRLPGQYYDSETGLFYNWNRTYNPAIGRYLSPDPIGQQGGLNLFSYAAQSPVMNSDPMGLQAVPLPIPGFAPPIVIPGSRQNKSWNQLSQQAVRNYCSVGAMTNGLFGVLCMTPQNPDDETKAASPETIQGQVCKNDDADDEEAQLDCDAERRFAREKCADIFAEGPNEDNKNIWGGSIYKCIMGHVSQACGGNRVTR